MDLQKTSRQPLNGRLEDSFSLPDNQKKFPEDHCVEEENHRLEKQWHERMASCREMEKKLGIKIC